MGSCHRHQARFKVFNAASIGFISCQRLPSDSYHGRKQVLGAMVQFANQHCLKALSFFSSRDVVSYFRGADNLAVGIIDWRDTKEDIDKLPVLSTPLGLVGLD